MSKACTKCREIKLFEDFSRDKTKKDNLRYNCKECEKKWRQENEEKIKEKSRKYREENKEKSKKWRQENKEKRREYMKKWRQENIEKKQEADKKWYEENKEYGRERRKEYYHKIKNNGTSYICPHCDYTTTFKNRLLKHNEHVHDIGKYTCDYCQQNRNSSIVFDDKNVGQVHICRSCFNKQTGKNSRIELVWSDYLDKEFGTEFLISSDKSLRSLGGCSLKRPDKLYASPDFVMMLECDEYQHNHKMSDYTCEEKRITELYDDPSISGKNLIVIRWNPDTYIPNHGKNKLKKPVRLQLCVELMKTIVSTPQSVDQPKIFVYYMFYDQDNPKIVKKIPSKLIYDQHDFK